MQQQLAQQKAVEAAQEVAADSSKRLQFKWAEKTIAVNKPLQVKSLAQIQQEEQERITKVKVLIPSLLHDVIDVKVMLILRRTYNGRYRNILATRKRTARKGWSERIREYAAECRYMGYSVAVPELG